MEMIQSQVHTFFFSQCENVIYCEWNISLLCSNYALFFIETSVPRNNHGMTHVHILVWWRNMKYISFYMRFQILKYNLSSSRINSLFNFFTSWNNGSEMQYQSVCVLINVTGFFFLLKRVQQWFQTNILSWLCTFFMCRLRL